MSIIFDVGCQASTFLDFKGEVHYFDPVPEFIETLINTPNKNTKSKLNKFGLGNETKSLDFYPKYQSFYDRTLSCGKSDNANKIPLTIKMAKDYIIENDIKTIDFLKIDTEGYELEVLQGFEEYIRIVKIIQFEYGGTFLDNNIKLIDVIQYLQLFGFGDFAYLTQNGTVPLTNYDDHYQYCNIVCTRK